MTQDVLSAEVTITGYSLYRSDRLGGRTHGGVAVYIRDDFTVVERLKYSNNCCESQVLEIKELELLLINIYRPPNSIKELFEDTLNRCQEIIDQVMEKEDIKSKNLLAVGDYNFPFIQWPSRRIYSREEEPEHMSSEKQQGKMLLDWSDKNFMEQFINTPTRKGNILDLVFTNSNRLINDYSTIVNSKFSDHNILKIDLNYEYKNQPKMKRHNPYPNTIYEYNLMNSNAEDWIRYDILLSKLSENFDEVTQNENTEQKLTRFYNLMEHAVETLFEKKDAFKTESEKKAKKG